MMISPESYDEEYLEKGKTKEQIMTAMRGLKQEIGRLKNSMENQHGGIYTLSKSEEKTADFDANMDLIRKITFSIGGYFGGYRNYIVELTDEFKSYTKLWKDKEPLFLCDDDSQENFTKDTFIAVLKDLHIGK